jgi:hypothetical protein
VYTLQSIKYPLTFRDILSFSTTICPRFRILPELALCFEMQLVDQFDKAWRRDGLFKMMTKEDRKFFKEFTDRVITTILLDKVQVENGPMSESTIVDNVLREGISA